MLGGVSEDPFIKTIFDKEMAIEFSSCQVPLAEEVGPCGHHQAHWDRGLTFRGFPFCSENQARIAATSHLQTQRRKAVPGLTSRESRSIKKNKRQISAGEELTIYFQEP